ncbi:uncharacterized protein LOC134931355 [Pseudophryne corroboree]|uniref:uncharacterized protein LOC134931355 n=1 Tax=Pseudophryne corroboree TaxID=495146 RepID=UPI0030818FDC
MGEAAGPEIYACSLTVTRQNTRVLSTLCIALLCYSHTDCKMPIILPQLPESMFSSYDPSYVPGYTGYTQKIRSDKGEIYGNATFKSADYEPGLQRPSQLHVSGWGGNHSPLINVQLGGKTSNTSRGHTGNWNNKNGYFHPLNGKYSFARMNYPYNGNPENSSAIKAIEEVKYELSRPANWTSPENATFDSLRDGIIRQSSFHGRNEQFTGTSSFPSYRKAKMIKKFQNDITERPLSTRLYNTNDYLQRRQGKLIYRTDCGLLPNYSGYIPGQMFAIGNTWGRSSVNALEKLHEQSFQWTSLI